MIDLKFFSQNARSVVHEGDLLVLIRLKLLGCRLKRGLSNRYDIDAIRPSYHIQSPSGRLML